MATNGKVSVGTMPLSFVGFVGKSFFSKNFCRRRILCRVGRAPRNPPQPRKWWVSLCSTHPTQERTFFGL